MPRIFVSYSRVDRSDVEELVRRLRRVYGHENVWMDDVLTGGDIWWEEILDQINACDIFIYMLSNESVTSPYCRAEYQEAYRLRKRIITAQIRDRTKLTDELAERQYVNMIDWERDPDQLNELHRAITKQAQLVRRSRPRYAGRTPKPGIPDAEEEQVQRDSAPPDKSSTLPAITLPQQPAATDNRRMWLYVASFVVVLLVVLGLAVSSFLGGDDASQTPTSPRGLAESESATATQTPAEVAMTQAALDQTGTATLWTVTPSPTETPSSTPTATATLTPTPTATNTPLPPGFTPIERNADWEPRAGEFSDVEMVLVPVGCFMMGSTDVQLENAVNELGGRIEWFTDEQPIGELCFNEPFWIDRYEVTRAAYRECVEDSACTQAPVTDYSSRDTQPVIQLNWFQALHYCEWRDGRLPTEAEWEYAARGPDSLVFPWGNEFAGASLVYRDNSGGVIADVGSRLGGDSWVGAYDLSGNVQEWTNTVYEAYPYETADGRENSSYRNRVARGGSFSSTASYTRAAARRDYAPDSDSTDRGFRCARSIDSGGPGVLSTDTSDVTPTPDAMTHAMTLAEQGVEANADWTPVMDEFDGVEMVLVPVGCFMMGSTDEQIDYAVNELGAQREGFTNEQPAHEICINEAFWIDRYEVTQVQFAVFGGQAGYSSYFASANRPRENITWFEAQDYCKLRGGRLPTEAEWEYAARGPDSLIYPWGNAFAGDNLVYNGNAIVTASVGSRLGGVSWVGAYDLSGNVWEWTNTIYDEYIYDATDGRESNSDTNTARVLRGGSFNRSAVITRSALRYSDSPDLASSFIGFRCARDY